MTRYVISPRTSSAQMQAAQLNPRTDYLDVSDDGLVEGVWGGYECQGEIEDRAGEVIIVWAPAADGTRYDPSSTEYRPGCAVMTIHFNDARTIWERR